MKAIKLLNDQDVLVYDRTRIEWKRDLGSLRNFVENSLGFTGVWKSTGGNPSSSRIRTRMLLLRVILVS